MKEFSSLAGGAKGVFLALVKSAGVALDSSLAMFAGASGAMVAGHEGIVVKIDWLDVPGTVPVILDQDQIITIAGEQYRLAKAGEPRKALTLEWSTGRTMTAGLLLQGQDKTTVLFKGDANPTPATNITLGDLEAKFLGKRFKCVKTFRDASNLVTRQNANGERSYPANCYAFEETTV